ncbi:MAG: phosphotransferase [Nitrospirae bacterium]|nr:phosphotransferase [Nitrospirota bacterium]
MKLNRPELTPENLLKQIQTEIEPKATSVNLTPLTGDASNRSYIRLDIRLNNQSRRSLVIMVLAEPEPFKQSEEKESGSVKIAELPFLNIQRYLSASGIAVPEVYYHDQINGLVYLEDLGDLTFEEVVKKRSDKEFREYYRRAIDTLIHLQRCEKKASSCIAFERSYNHPLLVWEFEHFREYGVEKKSNRTVSLDDSVVLKETFHRIATLISSEASVLVHRDYHSRNLMVQKEALRVIDFQDALLGPPQYDLASLLRDCYMTLPEELIDELLEYYLARKEKEDHISINRLQFRYLFDLVSLQRNMKAAGRFVFIDRVKKNPNFLKYVPKALKDISINIRKYPELKLFREVLLRYLPELA